MMTKRIDERGSVLISAYLTLMVVAVLGTAMYTRGHSFIAANERHENRITAFHMAEAGMDYAMSQLASDENYAGDSYVNMSTSTTSSGFTVNVQTPEDNDNVRIITTTGYAPGNDPNAAGYESRTVTSYIKFDEQKFFDYAVFSLQNFTMTGNAIIDSYDSEDGTYSSAPLTNGDVGTNSVAAGGVTLTGNSKIKGNVTIGPGGNPTTVVSTTANTSITGEKKVAVAARQDTAQSTGIASSGALSLSSNSTLTLTSGTYHYSSISITGNAQLVVNGTVTIYVDGNLNIAGNGISNPSGKPVNNRIFSSGTSVQFSGNGNFYGAVHAPNAAVLNSGNGNIYGAVLAKTYTQTGNGKVHYDESLAETGGTQKLGVKLLAWKENNTLSWNAAD